MKPRILVFAKFFWPEGGGAELATYILVKEVFSNYFNVTVVSGAKKPQPDVLKYCRYIYWNSLKFKIKPIEWLKLFLDGHLIRKLISNVDIIYIPSHTLIPLAIIAKKVKPEVRVVLHLHDYQPIAYTSVILYCNKPGLKNDIIVERYEHDSVYRAIATGMLQSANILNTVALHYADLIICVSRKQYEILTNTIPEVKCKTVIVYNPLPDVPLCSVKSKEPTIVYPGGSSYIKGFHIVLACLRRIIRKNLNIKFRLLGHYSSKALKMLNALRNFNIETIGRVSHNIALRIYGMSWALLFPSICEEPLPYVVMEAMAVGTIPVASKVGGVPEIVYGTYAERMLFEPGDVNGLIDKIESVLSLSSKQLIDIGYSLREVVLKRFNIEKISEQFLNILM